MVLAIFLKSKLTYNNFLMCILVLVCYQRLHWYPDCTIKDVSTIATQKKMFQSISLLTNIKNKAMIYKYSMMLRTDSTPEYPITTLNKHISLFDW